MYSLKLRWIVPIIALFVLITVIWVGIYQLNSDGNPWYFGGSDTSSGWDFVSE